jgi:DNA-binding response OmpR family regulator
VDPVRHEVRVDGGPVGCTPAEFELLCALAGEPGRVFTRAQLLERTTGFDRQSTERAVDMHVMNLRRKIEPDPRRPANLVTVFGIGYKLTGGTGEPPAGDEREP